MRSVPLLALCLGCVVTGQQAGGGEGLTLSTAGGSYTFPGATQGEMRSGEPGVASVYVPADDAGAWVVQATGDAFIADDVVTALGLPCPTTAIEVSTSVTAYRADLHYGDGIGTSDGYGDGTYAAVTGDAFAGETTQTLTWVNLIDGCAADLPSELTLTWSFDPEVAVTVRGGPTFELPGDPQIVIE